MTRRALAVSPLALAPLALVLAVGACSKSAPAPGSSPGGGSSGSALDPGSARTGATDAAVPAVATATPDAGIPTTPDALAGAAAHLPITSRQLVTAVVADWSATRAELRLWERDGEAWKLALGPWPGVVGTGGVAWGIGLHGSGAPAGRSGPVKQEGDGKSPAGAFGVRGSYGYARQAPATVLPYVPVDEHWECVDDPASRRYTAIVDARQGTRDWSSSEAMRRKDELYRWVVDVAHNPEAAPGRGSCIFLHVWRSAASPTVGCTAMEATRLKTLIERLEPTATYVLLPRTEYDALAPAWGLPPRT